MGIIDFECGVCYTRWRGHMGCCPQCGADVAQSHIKTALELGLVKGKTQTTLISGGTSNARQSG